MKDMDSKMKSELTKYIELSALQKKERCKMKKDLIRKDDININNNKTNVRGDNNKVSTSYNVIKNKPTYITFAIIVVGGITLNWSSIINITVNVIIG